MKTIDISDASRPLADYAQDANVEPLLVTRKGKPVAALVSCRGVDLESIRLSSNPRFIQIIEQSRDSIKKHGTISSEEMRKRLGIPAKRPAAPAARKRKPQKH